METIHREVCLRKLICFNGFKNVFYFTNLFFLFEMNMPSLK